jgi:hypothetical protein
VGIRGFNDAQRIGMLVNGNPFARFTQENIQAIAPGTRDFDRMGYKPNKTNGYIVIGFDALEP